MSTQFHPDELRQLEERLSNRLEALAPRPGADAAGQVRAAVAATPQRRGFVARLGMRLSTVAWREASMAAAVVVLAVAVGIGIGRSGLFGVGHASGSPQASGTVTGSPTNSASVQPTPTLDPALIYQDWRRTDLPQGTGQARGVPHGIVEFKGAMIAVGGADMAPCQGVPCISETGAAVWRTNTQATWYRLPDGASLRAGAMRSIVATADRLLVLGETTFSSRGTGEGNVWPELWVSTDGVTFTAYDAPAQFTAIAPLGTGVAEFLAAASTDAGPEIWSSSDGVSWRRDADAATLGHGRIGRIRYMASQALVVAVGSETTQDSSGVVTSHGVIWTSPGGQLWSRYDGVALEAGEVTDAAALGSRLVVVGSTSDLGTGLAWVSDDAGASWRRVDNLQFVGQALGEVIAVRDGWVARANGPNGGSPILTSLSGERWDTVPTQTSLGTQATIEDIALQQTSNSLFAVGIASGSSNPPASVWTSLPGESATSSASPALPTSSVYTSWSQVSVPDPLPHVYGGEWVDDVVAFKGGYVAVGGINGGCCDGHFTTDTRAAVWRSADGLHWTLVPDQPALALGHMSHVATNGNLLIAVGTQAIESKKYPGSVESRGAVWRSFDGVNWIVNPESHVVGAIGPPTFTDVLSTPLGFVATSTEEVAGSVIPGVSLSEDGITWRGLGGGQSFSTGTMQSIASTPAGMVAVGWQVGGLAQDGSVLPDRAIAWHSSDSSSWTWTAAGSLGTGQMNAITAGAGMIVAVGRDGDDSHLVVWRSADGRSWQRQDFSGLRVDPSAGPRILATARGFVAVALRPITIGNSGERSSAIVLTSPDGATWSMVARPGDSADALTRVGGATLLSGGQLLVFGARFGDPGHVALPGGVLVMP